jgi:transcription elongation GreA/GreB family factor
VPKLKKLPAKHLVLGALREAMKKRLASMADAAAQSREGATHVENRAEGDKDMRSTESSYLARGQAIRTEELAEELVRLEGMVAKPFAKDAAIAVGALVAVSVDDAQRIFFLAPYGGGTEVRVENMPITVVTPASPVGTALSGKFLGDEFELMTRGKLAEWVIELLT